MDGEKGGRGYGGGGKREIIYLSLHCHHQNDSSIMVGSDESHFNVSLINCEGQSHKTVSKNHNLFSRGTKSQDNVHKPQPFLKRKESQSGIEPRSFRLPA